VRRIAVIGNGGGGKSTLARALGKTLDLPVHEVDEVQWLPGWRRAPLDEVAPILEGWAADDAWIIDGFGPWPVIDRRMGRADTIVYVDLPHASLVGREATDRLAHPAARVGWTERASTDAPSLSHAARCPCDAPGSARARHQERTSRQARASSIAARDESLARGRDAND